MNFAKRLLPDTHEGWWHRGPNNVDMWLDHQHYCVQKEVVSILNNEGKVIGKKRKRTTDKQSLSHLSYLGGVYAIPLSNYASFFEHYATDLEKQTVHHGFSEQRTPVFRFHVDFDMEFIRPLDESEFSTLEQFMMPYLRIMMDVFKTFYFHLSAEEFAETFWFAFCPSYNIYTREPCEPRSDTTLKVGLHLVFPGLYVTSQVALILRRAVLYRFSKEPALLIKHALYFAHRWEKMMDEQVYTKNGLRMIGSYKTDICNGCGGGVTNPMNRVLCQQCHQVGKCLGTRIYYPSVVFTHLIERFTEREQQWSSGNSIKGLEQMLEQTSIRSDRTGTSPHFYQPEENPHVGSRDLYRESESYHSTVGPSGSGAGGKKRRKNEQESVEEYIVVPSHVPEYEMVQDLIRSQDDYRDTAITKLTRQEKVHKDVLEITYVAHINGPEGQRNFCGNVNRAHKRANIFFRLSNRHNTLVQRCFCQCSGESTLGGVPCSKYSRVLYTLSAQETSVLFIPIIRNWQQQQLIQSNPDFGDSSDGGVGVGGNVLSTDIINSTTTAATTTTASSHFDTTPTIAPRYYIELCTNLLNRYLAPISKQQAAHQSKQLADIRDGTNEKKTKRKKKTTTEPSAK